VRWESLEDAGWKSRSDAGRWASSGHSPYLGTAAPSAAETLLFFATFSAEIKALAGLLNAPTAGLRKFDAATSPPTRGPQLVFSSRP